MRAGPSLDETALLYRPPPSTLYSAAQKEIYWLMRKDTYPKFMESKDFKKAVKEYNKRQAKEVKEAKQTKSKSPKVSISHDSQLVSRNYPLKSLDVRVTACSVLAAGSNGS